MSSNAADEASQTTGRRSDTAPRGPDGGLFAPLRNALLDSRQRWRDLVTMSADFAFETDEEGRFTFVMPDPTLGWTAAALLGSPADQLLATPAESGGFSPFRTPQPIRRQRIWLRRQDGVLACIAFAAAPLLDGRGRQVGVRGLGIDVTEQDGAEASLAGMLRRSQALDHVLSAMRAEVETPNMTRAALDTLAGALGAEGAAVFTVDAAGVGPLITHRASSHAAALRAAAQNTGGNPTGGEPGAVNQAGTSPAGTSPAGTRPLGAPPAGIPRVDGARSGISRLGEPTPHMLELAGNLLLAGSEVPVQATTDEGRPLLVCPCNTRVGAAAGLLLWREPGGRLWDQDDRLLAGAATLVVRVVLEQDTLQHEIGQQARTDALTGLYNRRAFLEELPRHLDRLDREQQGGTLMYVDLDNFKPVNDQLGHQIGDQVLGLVAHMLRNLVRPTDLVARLGGDEFAVWMNGADHMTAAERAEHLRVNAPRILAEIAPGLDLPLTMSIGIASRPAGSNESIESVMRRADVAMYAVKRGGRGHWRVSHQAPV